MKRLQRYKFTFSSLDLTELCNIASKALSYRPLNLTIRSIRRSAYVLNQTVKVDTVRARLSWADSSCKQPLLSEPVSLGILLPSASLSAHTHYSFYVCVCSGPQFASWVVEQRLCFRRLLILLGDFNPSVGFKAEWGLCGGHRSAYIP